MGMSATSTGGRAGFPPFPDSAAGAFAFNSAFALRVQAGEACRQHVPTQFAA
ncbi:hypothetical protein J2Y66_002593 [Paenarthrobacter nitroguajacolicus]|nr:hypothetical protein [Paenarthrobacter nitroguajacolicus]